VVCDFHRTCKIRLSFWGFIKLGEFIKKCFGVYKIGWIYKKMWKRLLLYFLIFFFTFMKEIKKATAQKIANSNKNLKIKNCFDFDRFLKRGVRYYFFSEGRSSLCGVFFVRNDPNTKNRIARWFWFLIFDFHLSSLKTMFRLWIFLDFGFVVSFVFRCANEWVFCGWGFCGWGFSRFGGRFR